MPLVYLAHALGKDPVLRPRNIARVQRWFKFLIDYGPESWTINIPWLVYAQNLDEDTYRERGIRDGQAVLPTFDIICLVGGEDTRKSAGAAAERGTMVKLGKGVCDLLWLGNEPPQDLPNLKFLASSAQHQINAKWEDAPLTREIFTTQCVLPSLKLNHP